MAQWYEMIITILITINFCNAKKMNCALKFIKAIIMEENVLLSYYSVHVII